MCRPVCMYIGRFPFATTWQRTRGAPAFLIQLQRVLCRMLSALLLPLQVVVILVLHTCFALSRLVTLLRQLPLLARAQAERAAASTAQIDEDRLRWKKTPRRLAVSFATGRQWSLSGWTSSSSSGSERKRRGEEREVRKVVEDVRRLVTWCDQLGMEELSLYDEQGELLPPLSARK